MSAAARRYALAATSALALLAGTCGPATAQAPSLPFAQVVAVAAGGGHTCAIDGAGAAWCWGKNGSGQLGDGSFVSRRQPVPVSGLPAAVLRIAAGAEHTCAVVAGGQLWCWGNNEDGQVGIAGDVEVPVPVAVATPGGPVVAVALGESHSCARRQDGAMFCWGYNSDGQLGDGSTDSRYQPAPVAGLPAATVAIAAGSNHSCAVVAGGAVWCWGGNAHGQLGLGTRDPWLVPAAVAGQGSVTTTIAAGIDFTCSRRDDGTVWCWGRGDAGQMGQASPNDSLVPFPIANVANAVGIATGSAFACARIASGGLRCWGDNSDGALGDTTIASRARPEPVEGIGNAQAVAAGDEHACAIRGGGQLWCWGDNGAGALGDGAATSEAVPVVVARPEPDVTGLAIVDQLSLGDQSSCLINASRRLECWGGNRFGVLGDGSESQRLEVSFIAFTVLAHSSRGDHACSITSDQTGISGGGSVGLARCWGLNYAGQLGDGSLISRPSPAPITGAGSAGHVTAIATGHSHSCLVHGGSGARACTGFNSIGQACQGDLLDRSSFEDCAAVTAATVALAAGGDHTCALTASGAVRCWGGNDRGQLGNGSQTPTALPAGVSGLGTGNLAVAAGTSHTCALNAARGVVCWGSNQSGQLGNGSLVDSTVPVPVSGLAGDVQALALGSDFSCALTVSGTVFCWGSNNNNQLGDGTSERRLVPTPVLGLGTGVSRIGAGGQHACAVVGGSEIRCWGSNLLGQLGTGTARLRAWPAPVLRLDLLFADGFE